MSEIFDSSKFCVCNYFFYRSIFLYFVYRIERRNKVLIINNCIMQLSFLLLINNDVCLNDLRIIFCVSFLLMQFICVFIYNIS